MQRIRTTTFLETNGLAPQTNGIKPYKKNAEWTDEYLHYAWEISGQDKTFIYLLACENGEINPNRRSLSHYFYKNKKHYDWGFCQISSAYYPHITQDNRFFTDWKWQMEKCYELYKNGTRFYGLANIKKCSKIIEWR